MTQSQKLVGLWVCDVCKREYFNPEDARLCETECHLKPCPYCGGVPAFVTQGDHTRVVCGVCAASTGPKQDAAAAKASWDSRFGVL